MTTWILVINSSGYDLAPVQCQAITWTNDDLFAIGPLGINFIDACLKHKKNVHFKMLFGKFQPFLQGLMS